MSISLPVRLALGAALVATICPLHVLADENKAPASETASSAPSRQAQAVDAEAPASQDAAQPNKDPAPKTERAGETQGKPPLMFTFRETPWPEVLRQFAEWTNLTLDLTDEPPGAFSYYDNRLHTPSEAIDILNGYLLPRGYVLLRRDRFLVVIKTDNPILPNLVPTIDLEDLGGRGENELLRVVVPLDEVDPETAAEEIKPMLGPHGSVAALNTSNSLVVQGFGRILRDVVTLLSHTKPPVTDDKLDFRAFPLKHILAAEAEKQIRTLFGLNVGATNVSRARYELERSRYYRSRRRGDEDNDDEQRRSSQPTPLLQHMAMNMQVSALARTNSLLVTATPAGLALVESILSSIDVAPDDAAVKVVNNDTPVLRVYAIEDADEEEVAKTLDVVMPGVVVNEDRRQDSIHILATPPEHDQVESLIRTLDGGGLGGNDVEVIPLRRFDAYTMSTLLSGMFENEDRDERPIIQAEPQTGTLLVRGAKSQVEQVRRALVAYGEDGAQPGAGGPRFRRVVVGQDSAEGVARVVKEIFSQDRRFENPIRVVTPGKQPSEDRSRSRDDAPEPPSTTKEKARLDLGDASTGQYVKMVSLRRNSREKAGLPAKREVSVERDDVDPAPNSRGGRQARVNIEVRGDQLFLYSADEAALNEVEEMIRDLVRQMPSRRNWTVFYLRAAEAVETASQLHQLMSAEMTSPPSAVTLAGAGVGVGANTLHIVPDPRTNALFVSGPSSQVDQVEGFLELLDEVELPESFRERVPHTITVQYADVNEIASMIAALYADHLTDPAARRREEDRRDRERDSDRDQDRQREQERDENGRSRGPAGPSPGVRLTMAVDERTNQLILTCDEPLYREIAALVKERDLAIRDAQPTVRMVPFRFASPTELSSVLQAISPKTAPTTTEASSPPTVSAPSSRSRFGRDRDDNRDRDRDRDRD